MIKDWYVDAVGRLRRLEKGLNIRGKIDYLFMRALVACAIVALPILLIEAYAINQHLQKNTSETVIRLVEDELASYLRVIDIAALQTLTVRLSELPQIDRLCLFNNQQVLVKSYGSDCKIAELPFLLPIYGNNQQPVGYFYSDNHTNSRYLIGLQILATIILIMLFFLLSLYMLRRLQALITQPLLVLSRAAEAFMRTNDFHIRVQKHDDDEIGRLSEVFNRLLQDMRKKEHDLIKAKNDADVANEMKSDFLASVSHEIRTPMNGVIGTAELLMASVDTQKQRNYVSTILRSSENLLSIINDILDFSKIESGKLDIESIPFNIYSEIEDVADLMAIKACEKRIEIIVSISPYVPENLLGDPSRIRQVLTNLVSNAVKFTENGHILIEVESIGCAVGEQKIETLKFSVQDTGIGIAQDAQKRIFERFTQAESSITRQYGGTGLGLAICKQLVELMGGKIYVESTVGKGSIFTFILSLELDAEQQSGTTIELEDTRVLIVDDNPFFNEHMKAALRFYGMHPVCALTADEAQAIIAEQPTFDLLIIDDNMSPTSGCDLAEKINEQYADDSPPIILLNEIYGSAERDRIYEQVGIAAYMQKPVRIKQLAELIELTLHEHHHGSRQNVLSVDQIREVSKQLSRPLHFASPNIFIYDNSDVSYQAVNKILIHAGCQVRRVPELTALAESANRYPVALVIISLADNEVLSENQLQQLARFTEQQHDKVNATLPIIALMPPMLNEQQTNQLKQFAVVTISKQLVRADLINQLAKLLPDFVLDKTNTQLHFDNVKVLLVEDNRTNAQITSEILAEFGCQVHVCDNGKKALEAFAKDRFDLILMDCQMPVMDGFESTRHIREFEQEGSHPTTPIIALTANAMKGDSERCINAGMNDYLSKPIKRDKLRNVLTRFISHQKLIVEPSATKQAPLIEQDTLLPVVQHYRASGRPFDHLLEDFRSGLAVIFEQYQRLTPQALEQSLQVTSSLAKLLGFLRLHRALQSLLDAALELPNIDNRAMRLADSVRSCQQIYQATIASLDEGLLTALSSDHAIELPVVSGITQEATLPVIEVDYESGKSTADGKVTFVNFKHLSEVTHDASAPKGAVSLVDLTTFNSTKLIFKAKFDHVLGEYIEDCDSYIATIKDSLKTSDYEEVRQSAHPLKSSSLSLGFNAVGEIAKRIETAARNGDALHTIADDLSELQKAYESTKAFIHKENAS